MDLDGATGVAISFRYPEPASRTHGAGAGRSPSKRLEYGQCRRAGPQPPFLSVVDTASQPHRPLRPNPANRARGAGRRPDTRFFSGVSSRECVAARRSTPWTKTAATLALAGICERPDGVDDTAIFLVHTGTDDASLGITLTWQSNATMYADDDAAIPLSSLVTQISNRTSSSMINNPGCVSTRTK